MNLSIGKSGLDTIRAIADVWRSGRSSSLIDYTKTARVEPIVVIDSDVMFYEGLIDVMQSLQNIYAGYYLQAVALSATVGKIEVGRHLDKFNPNRSVGDAAVSGILTIAKESFEDSLPMYDRSFALEADDVSKGSRVPTGLGAPKDAATTLAELKELANLSVGKMLNVTITDGNNVGTVPVSIRLIASSMPSSNLVHILSLGKQDTSVKERYYGWKSGRLDFIKDNLLCLDLIDAHRKNLMDDADGVYTNIIKRQSGNKLASLLSGGDLSVATASNMVIMSAETAAELELKINGALKNFKIREGVLKETSMMLMVVIEKQWDRVRIYHRGIPEYTDLSLRDIKTSNKGTGPDVSEILKAYQLGSAPSL